MSAGERRLVAIMFTDMVGYTALGQRNEALSLILVEEQRKLIRPVLARHKGRGQDHRRCVPHRVPQRGRRGQVRLRHPESGKGVQFVAGGGKADSPPDWHTRGRGNRGPSGRHLRGRGERSLQNRGPGGGWRRLPDETGLRPRPQQVGIPDAEHRTQEPQERQRTHRGVPDGLALAGRRRGQRTEADRRRQEKNRSPPVRQHQPRPRGRLLRGRDDGGDHRGDIAGARPEGYSEDLNLEIQGGLSSPSPR